MSEADNKTLARRFIEEVVNTGEASRLTEFLASDFRERSTGLIRSFLAAAICSKTMAGSTRTACTRLLPLLLVLALPAAAQGQFNFVTNKGTITITKYTGSGGAVTIPSTTNGHLVTTIEKEAFFSCKSLRNITIPDGLISIGESVFGICNSLTNVTISDSVTSIGSDAFIDCSQLTTVTIGNSVTNIGELSFAGCTNLIRVSIPKNVTRIGHGAFASCWSLTGVYFQGHAPAGGDQAFDQRTKVTIYYRPGTKGWGKSFSGRPTAIWNAPEEKFADGVTAQQILDKMATTYATCKSYRDSGVVTNDFGPHNATDRYPRHIDIKPFRTAFVRPDQFRFEYDDATPDKPYIIWAKGGEVRTWWHVRQQLGQPGVESPPSLDHGVGGATGVSSGSAHTIPVLLLPDQITGARLSAMTDLTRLPDETLHGTPCFKLDGKYGFGHTPTTLWLEKETYLIRRIAEDTGLTKRTTIYWPEVNKEIPANELEFNAPKAP